MRKFLSALCMSIVLFSCEKETLNNTPKTSAATAAEGDNNVTATQKIKLIKTWSVYAYVYSGLYNKQRNFYTEVAKSAYPRQVFVHHKMADGTWQDFPMKYMRPATSTYDVWYLEDAYSGNGGSSSHQDYADEFVLRYEVNGKTYYDNNNGQNYKIGLCDGMYLRDGLPVSAETFHSYLVKYSTATYASFYIEADVKNLAYSKEVKVIYSTDNWQTTNTAPLNFITHYALSDFVVLPNPNIFNNEKWSVYLNLPGNAKYVDYAISYKVNGTEYWDNNYGRNYRIKVENR